MNKLSISISSEISNIVKVENFVETFTDYFALPSVLYGKISLSVIEAVNNAIFFASFSYSVCAESPAVSSACSSFAAFVLICSLAFPFRERTVSTCSPFLYSTVTSSPTLNRIISIK